MSRTVSYPVGILFGLSCLAQSVEAAELQARTAQAYEKHSEQAVREFVARHA